jgi:hypothetical protein
MTSNESVVLFNGCGAARFLGRPEYWGRTAFLSGLLPVEGLINGQYPAITATTLKRLAPGLRKLARKRKELN